MGVEWSGKIEDLWVSEEEDQGECGIDHQAVESRKFSGAIICYHCGHWLGRWR